jgi:hypothetical protein
MIMVRKHASRSSLLYPKMTNASLYRQRNSSVKVENGGLKTHPLIPLLVTEIQPTRVCAAERPISTHGPGLEGAL